MSDSSTELALREASEEPRGKKMHGARYTSGTEFYLATGDIYATQQLLGHADVSTTANIYVQASPAGLEAKLRKVWGE